MDYVRFPCLPVASLSILHYFAAKNGELKSIVHVIKYVDFELYRAFSAGVILKKKRIN